MIMTLSYAQKETYPRLFDDMFRARAVVFSDRLGWDVKVRDGREIDRYDTLENPVYLMSLDSSGQLRGSLRLLPTTGQAMLHNEFAEFFDEPLDIRSPLVWECTRFCVHPLRSINPEDSGRSVSSELLIGLCELAAASGIDQIVGLYDYAMIRVYRRIGWSPTPLVTSRSDVGHLVTGIWDVSPNALAAMKDRQLNHSETCTIARQAA